MSGHKSFRLYSIAILMSYIVAESANGLYLDYSDLYQNQNIEVIHQKVGYDIELKCGQEGRTNTVEGLGTKIQWYFKACKESYEEKTCHDSTQDDWTHLPCHRNICNSTLYLRNVTENYSGIYKCTTYPYRLDASTTLDIQLVRTFQLHVRNGTITIPKFLDTYPANQTTSVGSKAVFQCRVLSEVHPTIKWFRRVRRSHDDIYQSPGMMEFNSPIVHYFGQTYELLESAREKILTENTYLSKLIINRVAESDEGFYACVAINYRGHIIREAYLTVEPEMEYWEYDDYENEETDPTEFWLLFLMPVGLAMLPLSFWLCYIVSKRCSNEGKVMRMHDEESSLRGGHY